MEKSGIFLDSSILITAVLSQQGGSFYLLTQFNKDYEFQINDYVLEETTRVLTTKFPDKTNLKTNLFLLIGVGGIKILPNPFLKQIKILDKILNQEDAPILASAVEHSSYLITLDNDFFAENVINFAQNKNLIILKPKDFIELNRGK